MKAPTISSAQKNVSCNVRKYFVQLFIVFSVIGLVVFTYEFSVLSKYYSTKIIPQFFHTVINQTTNIDMKHSTSSSAKSRSNTSRMPTSISNAKTTLSVGLPSNQTASDFKQTHFMTVTRMGQLGNQMFQFAALIGTACRHNYTPFLSTRHQLNRVFDLKQARDITMKNVATVGERKALAYNSQLNTLSHDKNWTLSGFFQSWKYFEHCKSELVSSFKFKSSIKRRAIEVLKTIRSKDRPLVSVHIRRGDKLNAGELKKGNSVATPQYVSKAMTYFRNVTKSPIFIVVSDDRKWCKTYIKGNDVIYAGTGNMETDLAILSLCNHSIISSGTFGWWGAYLSGGKTVYFSNFPVKGSWLASIYVRDDYYPLAWVGME